MIEELVESYYGLNNRTQSEFILVPSSVFIYGDILYRKKEYLILTKPNILEEINLALKEKRVSQEILWKKYWETKTIFIQGRYVREFNKSGNKKYLKRIFELVLSSLRTLERKYEEEEIIEDLLEDFDGDDEDD